MFVLIALTGILFAMFRSATHNVRAVDGLYGDRVQMSVNAIAGLIAGLCIGGWFSRSYDAGHLGAPLAALSGAAAGALGGAVAAVPFNPLITVGGAALLMVMALVMRVASARREWPAEAPPPELMILRPTGAGDPLLPTNRQANESSLSSPFRDS